ncbi:uncharacterized protein LOC129972275 [Argiope bruennichi]|uniref:uncharacterized protein LOC129972275 n=1 Tax=Argiope bruennichi TaxID=94029 RepID=UPI002495045E|nr:uncharacterized protein LOC129972275 [Argiope bruennichi]
MAHFTDQLFDRLITHQTQQTKSATEVFANMGKSKEGIFTGEFAATKEIDVPVSPCQGWINPCEFCDKRFGDWVEASDENLAKISTNPGILMVGLKSKNNTEIVSISLHSSDIQKISHSCIDYVKHRIADKKSKFTKAVILCRWLTLKNTDDKDAIYLYAHWYNNGILPRFVKSWPGLDNLQNTDSLMFSDDLQKWCHLPKEAFWKKPKPLSVKLAEEVRGCSWTQPCEICDMYFSPWKRLDDVVTNGLAPDCDGVYMVSRCSGRTREVVDISYKGDILVNIKKSLQEYFLSTCSELKRKELESRNVFYEVRWLVVTDPENDDACFLYAHWLNADTSTGCTSYIIDYNFKKMRRKKNFIVRTRDRKWCYEIDAFKQIKESKAKSKKHILNDLREDVSFISFDT